MVAEVAAHLAADRRHGVAQEVGRPLGVVAAGRLDQSEAGHLFEVFHGDPARSVAPRDVQGDLQIHLDELVLEDPSPLVVGVRHSREQDLGRLTPGEPIELDGVCGFGRMLLE